MTARVSVAVGAGQAGGVRRWAFLILPITIAWTDAHAADPPPEASAAAGTAEPAPSLLGDPEVSKVECFKHHEDAQIARRERRLLAARSGLRLCSRASCPGAIRADCVDWFEEVNRSVPSVVVTARARGRDVTNVKVFVDGSLVADRLTGAAFEFDPGEHKFLFQSPPWPPKEHTILVSEGVKGRAIDIEFAPPVTAAIAPKPGEGTRGASLHPANRFDYLVGGVGAASLVTSAVFGGWALWLRHHYESTCAPFCGEEEKTSVRSKFVIADAALGLALVSAVVVYLHLARPHPPGTGSATGASATGFSLLVGAAPNEPQLGIRGAF